MTATPTPAPGRYHGHGDHDRHVDHELAADTLARYGARAVTDAMVADLIARGEDAALHALLNEGAAGAVPRPAWDRYLAARAAQQPTL